MNSETLAQDIMDAYYQDYKGDDEFFDLDYFSRKVIYEYDGLLKEEFDKERMLLLRLGAAQELMVLFDTSWLTRKDFTIAEKKQTVELDEPVYTFPFVNTGTGIQDVVTDSDDIILARVSESGAWNQKYFPKKTNTVIWYSHDKTKITFKGDMPAGKVSVLYLPSIADGADIANGLAAEIQKRVLNVMIAARSGEVIDTTNDGNEAQSKETEINRDQLK